MMPPPVMPVQMVQAVPSYRVVPQVAPVQTVSYAAPVQTVQTYAAPVGSVMIR